MEYDSDDVQHIAALSRLRLATIEIEHVMKVCRAPSISYGILHKGKVLYQRSIGCRDVELGLPADSDTSYAIGSCSKMITSLALGILAHDGSLAWNDTIQKHIPTFDPVEDPEIAQKATIVDACRHTTGLANPNAVCMGPGVTLNIAGEQHITLINALPTFNTSGQRFRRWWTYSNAVFGLMATVIENASGMGFSEYIQKRILDPLGLSQTMVSGAAVEANANVANPAVQMADTSWRNTPFGFTSEAYPAMLASLGMRSSVSDLLTLLNAVMDRYEEETAAVSTDLVSSNPLGQVSDLWNYDWWTRPIDDGFESDARYLFGWYRTTMPTGGLGLTSNNFGRLQDEAKSYRKYIIGQESAPRVIYGHNGVVNGSVATAYLCPTTHSAIVALSNGSDAGDAAEITAQILLQALFDLQPRIDFRPAVEEWNLYNAAAHESMISEWQRHRNEERYTSRWED